MKMRSLCHLIGLLTVMVISAWSQSPPGFHYQAVLRNEQGAVVKSQTVGVQIRILKDTEKGAEVYSESHVIKTTPHGNINLRIGSGKAKGSLKDVDWGAASHFISLGLDLAGGENFTDAGVAQLMSVPYALHSVSSERTSQPPQKISLGNDTLYLSHGGGSVKLPTSIPGSVNQISDADGNTQVIVEKTPNDDVVRFQMGGQERMRMRGYALEFVNSGSSVFVGDSAGANANGSNRMNVFLGDKSGKNNTVGTSNVFTGFSTGANNTTGNINVILGSAAGFNNTSGQSNNFLGASAGFLNTTGGKNIFIGTEAGRNNTTSDSNLFIGHEAGYNNSVGKNQFIGNQSGRANTVGEWNTFLGYRSGFRNTAGFSNTFSGYESGLSNTTGNYNTFAGQQSGYSNVTGSANTFMGHQAGRVNTAGLDNTFMGAYSGHAFGSGSLNTFIGKGAGGVSTNGTRNTFLGADAGAGNSGASNTFIGAGAGQSNAGTGNVFIGAGAGSLSGESNALIINNSSASIPLIYGNFSRDSVAIRGSLRVRDTIRAYAVKAHVVEGTIVNVYGQLNQFSDERLKSEVTPIHGVVEKLGRIQGVYHRWNKLSEKVGTFPAGRQIGVMAQDVEKEFPELISTHANGYKTMDYVKLSAILLEAVKGLNKQNQELSSRLDRIEMEVKRRGREARAD